MSGLDMWQDGARRDVVRVLMIDPHNYGTVRGELDGIKSVSITEGYYTDTRISASVSFLSDESNYIEDSWLRIVHECPDYGYSNVLGTFAVNPKGTKNAWKGGAKITSLSLESALWSISQDLCPYHFGIGEGSKSLDVFDRICESANRPYLHKADARNHRYGAAKVYEASDSHGSWLSLLFDNCDASNNRLNVDWYPRVTIEPYFEPSTITPTWIIDTDDDRSLVIDDEIGESVSDNAYGRTIVSYTGQRQYKTKDKKGNTVEKTKDVEIYAYADAPSNAESSFQRRGYRVASLHSITDMTPQTKVRAQQLANQYLATEMAASREWSFKALYFPTHQGECITFKHDGESHHCLVKSLDPVTLYEDGVPKMTMTVTLKEV